VEDALALAVLLVVEVDVPLLAVPLLTGAGDEVLLLAL
jgi:hypothetical protein